MPENDLLGATILTATGTGFGTDNIGVAVSWAGNPPPLAGAGLPVVVSPVVVVVTIGACATVFSYPGVGSSETRVVASVRPNV